MRIAGLQFSKSSGILIYSFLLIFLLSDIAIAQTQKSRIIEKYTFDNEPIEIIEVKTNQTSRKIDQEFVHANDWLNDFSIEFKNKYKKTITFVEIALDFPETKSSGNIMAFPVYYGSRKIIDNAGLVRYNETAKIILSESNASRLKKFIESRQLLNDLTQVKLRISFIKFYDATAWSGGNFMRQSPEDPNKYIPIE